MITKTVSVPVLDRVATIAEVNEARDGIVVYDLFDADRLLAKSRYSLNADAPFVLTAEEVIELNTIIDVEYTQI